MACPRDSAMGWDEGRALTEAPITCRFDTRPAHRVTTYEVWGVLLVAPPYHGIGEAQTAARPDVERADAHGRDGAGTVLYSSNSCGRTLAGHGTEIDAAG